MYAKRAVIFSVMSLLPSVASSQVVIQPGSERPQLTRLSTDEAASLIVKLEDAQAKLRNGEKLYFSLSGGAPASFAQAKISPLQMFLGIRFQEVLVIERLNKDPSLQRFKLAYAPRGVGQAYWEVEAALDATESVSSVDVMYRIPPPY